MAKDERWKKNVAKRCCNLVNVGGERNPPRFSPFGSSATPSNGASDAGPVTPQL